jgi:hypothetical protein
MTLRKKLQLAFRFYYKYYEYMWYINISFVNNSIYENSERNVIFKGKVIKRYKKPMASNRKNYNSFLFFIYIMNICKYINTFVMYIMEYL